MESTPLLLSESNELYTPSATSKELLDQVDPEEFKRKMIAQVMQSTSGKQPLDYYLADLAVSCWMNHMEKTPEEFERMITSIPLPQPLQPDEGGIHVEGVVLEEPVIMVERKRETIADMDE